MNFLLKVSRFFHDHTYIRLYYIISYYIILYYTYYIILYYHDILCMYVCIHKAICFGNIYVFISGLNSKKKNLKILT